MSLKPQTFKSTLRLPVKEGLLTGYGLGILLPLAFYYYVHATTFEYMALLSLLGVSALPGYKMLKFYIFARPAITISPKGIAVFSFYRKKREFYWREIEQVFMRGNAWHLKTMKQQKLRLHFNGLPSSSCAEINTLIRRFCVGDKSKNVPDIDHFKPEYESILLIALLGVGFMVAGGWILQVSGFADFAEHTDIFLAFIAMTLIFMAFPFFLIKHIRFGAEISIYRYGLPVEKMPYSDILGVNVKSLFTKKGTVAINSMKNADHLLDILEKKLLDGALKREQLGELGAAKDANAIKALMVSVPLTIFVLFSLSYTEYQLAPDMPRVSYLGILAIIYLIVFFLFRRRSEKNAHESVPF